MRLNIGYPVVRTDGRAAGGVRSRDYQIFGMGRFTYPWCSAGAMSVLSNGEKALGTSETGAA